MRARTVSLTIVAVLGLVGAALAVFVASFDANRYKPQLVELVRTQTGRTLTIDGDLGLSLWPRIGLSMGSATLSGPDGQGEAARIASAHLAVALRPLLSGTLRLDALSLRGLDLATNEAGGGWRLEAAQLDAAPIADGESGRLTLTGQLRDAAGSDLAIRLDSAFLGRQGAGTLRLTDLVARLDGPAAGLQNLGVTLNGQADVDLRARQLVADALALAVGLGDGPRLALAGSGRVDAAQESATLALAGTLDDTPVELAAQLDRFAPLSAKWRLTVGTLDLDRLQAALAAARRPPPERPAAAAPDTAAGPPASGIGQAIAIAGIASRGELAAERLRVSGMALSKLSATLVTGQDRIAIESLTATLNGGRLQAEASLADAGHRLRGSLAGVDAGALLLDASGRDLLAGRGDVGFDLRSQGLDADSIVSALGGSLSVALRDGAIKGLDVERMLEQVKSAIGGRLPVEGSPRQGEQTPFKSLTASFRVENGIATSQDLDFRADWLSAKGRGQVDLPARSLDWLIHATPGQATAGSAGSERRDLLARLQGLSVPVRLSGSFDAIRYRVDLQDLAAELARSELQRRLADKLGETLGEKPGESPAKPLDLLKGLLRR